MASRVMISPVVSSLGPRGSTILRSKAEQYCDAFVNFFPSNQDGSSASLWVLTLGRASSWTAAQADSEIEFLFPLPANVDTADELRAFLRGRTIGDLTVAQRNNLHAVLDNHGVNRADFTLETTGAKVLQRVVAALAERDFGFGMGFRF